MDADKVEKVQRRATRMIPGLQSLQYEQRLQRLNLHSLFYRRRRGDMITVYKLLNGKLGISSDIFFTPAIHSATRGHKFKLFTGRSRCMSTEQSSSLSVPPHQKPDVLSAVRSDINQGRMFAIVYISGAQHKVTTGDLVLLQNHIKADVGDIIRLEKILLLGGDNFTLIGKPMLSLDTVRVEATVIEKTVSEKKVHFRFKRRKRFSSYRERQTDLTVLRINSIEAQLR
nr:39S ribosomal protein L21, mitochondrial-like [Lytechinus pictus]